MAVEAQHLHLFPSLKSRETMMNAMENQSPAMGFVNPAMGPASIAIGNNMNPSNKRSRESSLSFLGDDLSFFLQQQMLDVDRFIAHHTEKMKMGLLEARKRFLRQVVAAAEERVAKRLKAKEEEIERIGRLNWALEERVKSLGVENQVWRYLAQTNEAAANSLRNNLEQVLAEQVRVKEEHNDDAPPPPPAEDAESCCCGDNWEDVKQEVNQKPPPPASASAARMCRNCSQKEPSVLLLPCRHLCLCSACGPAADVCPICRCCMTGSVNVNLS